MDMFQKASCPCHLELCFYTLPEPLPWWQNWMAPDSQHLLNKSSLKDTKSSSPPTPTGFSQKEAVWIWAPKGLGKRLKPWLPTKRALQTPTPAASVSCFTSWLGLFAFLRHIQGGVCLLSACKIQLPKICNQRLRLCTHQPLRDQKHLR